MKAARTSDPIPPYKYTDAGEPSLKTVAAKLAIAGEMKKPTFKNATAIDTAILATFYMPIDTVSALGNIKLS